jgi:hypothetical protein
MEFSVDIQYAIFCICYDFNKYYADLIIYTMRLYVMSYLLT